MHETLAAKRTRRRRPFLSQEAFSEAVHPRSLHLIVLPTEHCNFRCTYCYEDFAAGKMSPALVGGIKRLIDRWLDDLLGVGVSWFGGEPLLAKDIVFDVSEHTARRCAERGVTNLGGGFTTNGYLPNPAVMERLVNCGQRDFQIPLDGLGAVHDRSRPLRSGCGSFTRIWGNLHALRETDCDFHIMLRVHVGNAAEGETAALCRELNSCFGGDKRFSAYFRPIANWGGPNRERIRPLSAVVGPAQIQRFGALLPDLPNNIRENDSVQHICYAAKPNTLLIRAGGRVGKCTVALDDPRNTVGRLDEEGRLHIDNDRFRLWLSGFEKLDPAKLSCPYSAIRKAPCGTGRSAGRGMLRRKIERTADAAQGGGKVRAERRSA
jgi:uncharacterized protein